MAVTVSDNNKIPDLIKRLTNMKNRTIEAGILEDGEQAMIAYVHEYGVDIEVTPAMRGYLHSIDIHLRKETTHISIPERSFIRSGWDNNIDDIASKMESLIGDVLDMNIDAETFLNMMGLEIEGKLKDQLVELSDPPNHPSTVERKGSSNPLVDSGGLLNSISYKVK